MGSHGSPQFSRYYSTHVKQLALFSDVSGEKAAGKSFFDFWSEKLLFELAISL